MDINFFNLIKGIYDKLTANIILKKRLKAFPLKSETRRELCSSPLLVAKIGKKKGIQIGKERALKLSVLADNIILYTENPRENTHTIIRANNFKEKMQDIKSILKVICVLLNTTSEQAGQLRKQFHSQHHQR